jgi:hypothetical protein
MEHFYKNIHGWATEADQLLLLRKILLDFNSTLQKKHLTIAELGVWRGKLTAMWVVELLNQGYTFDYYAIDWFTEKDYGGLGGNTYDSVKKNLSPIVDKINLIKSSTMSAAQTFGKEHFDIVYIDASHDYHNVISDIKTWLPKVKKGGYICGDDYISGWPGVVQAVNESFDKWQLRFIGGQQWASKIT